MDALMRAPALPLPMSTPAIESLFSMRRFAARLRPRRVRLGAYELPFLEGGEGEPLVLLHGFSDNKDTFVDLARMFTSHRRVIIPDLLGFGEASQPREFDYRLETLAAVVAELLDVLGVYRYDLGGNSLGGAVATSLALARPDAVRSLTLIASAGVEMPRPSPLQRMLDEGQNPFVLDSHEAYRSWVRFVLERPLPLPPAVERYLADEFIARASLNEKIMDDLLGGEEELTERLSDIQAPTLVLWGDRDRLIDISAGQVFHRRIPDARFVILHGIGHCPQLEAPRQTARALRDFLRGLETRF
jgi:pimeloyl-ACP methyl ester carboxylesterase